MKTDTSGKIKLPSSEQQENIKNTRKTLKVLQQTASNKENLVGRAPRPGKEYSKVSDKSEINDSTEVRKKKFASKHVQTDKVSEVTAEDLTSEDEPSEGYWKALAEKRRVALDESLEENQKLHEEVAVLKEENRICKQMLDESRCLVEVLNEMLGETDTSINKSTDSVEEPEEKTDNE